MEHRDMINLQHRYRFAEIEIYHVIENIVSALEGVVRARPSVFTLIKGAFLLGRSDNFMTKFEDALLRPDFRPTKNEMALYLAYLDYSMPEARKRLGGISPNAYYGLKKSEPFQIYPKFDMWDETLLEQVEHKLKYFKGTDGDKLYFIGNEGSE